MAQRNELQEFHLTTLANLPEEMVGEVLSRVPLSTLREFQMVMPKADHSLKTILSNVWRARHQQYFPKANQESIKWLLANGESWFSIFMNDYRADEYLGDLERKFKNSNIHDVVDCLIRNDVSGFKSLKIDWRKFYDWLVTYVGVFRPAFYLTRLIACSSTSIRNHVYENLKSEILEKPLNHPVIGEENMVGLARALSVICGQSLVEMGDSWADFVDDNKAVVLGAWRGTLFDFAIMVHNKDIVTAVFAAADSFANLDAGQQSMLLMRLNSGLDLMACYGCGVLSDNLIKNAVELLVSQLDDVIMPADLPYLARIAGDRRHIDLMKRFLTIYAENVGVNSAEMGLCLNRLFDLFVKLSHVIALAAIVDFHAENRLILDEERALELLKRTSNSASVFVLYEALNEPNRLKIQDLNLMPKMFVFACMNRHHLASFDRYLKKRQADLDNGAELRFDWVKNIERLYIEMSSGLDLSHDIKLSNVSCCVKFLLKLAPGDINDEVIVDVIKWYSMNHVYFVNNRVREPLLAVLRTLFGHVRDKFNLVNFLSKLYKVSNINRYELLSVAFEVMGEPVVMSEQAPALLKWIGKFRKDRTVSESLAGSGRGRLRDQLSALENKLFLMVSGSVKQQYLVVKVRCNHAAIMRNLNARRNLTTDDSDEEESSEQEDEQPLPSSLPTSASPDASVMSVDAGLKQALDDVTNAAGLALTNDPERKSEVDDAVVAVEEMIQSPTDQAKSDKVIEMASTLSRDSSSSMRKLGIAMMVVGVLSVIAGTLIIAASMSAATTGILAVLAAPGVTFGVTLAVTGTAIALAGFGMFSGKQAELSEMSSEQQLGFSL